MSKTIITFISNILIFYISLGALLYLFQRSFIYFPSSPITHEFDEFIVNNEGNEIKSIALNQDRPTAFLYFGGNAESVVYTAREFQHQLANYAQYFVNYRGYGGSSGTPTESALFSDALLMFDELASRYEAVVVIGRSLGSGVAAYVASKRTVNKLVLVTPFDSILSVAQRQFPIYPMSLMLKDQFNSAIYASNIQGRVLILIAEHDEVIHRRHSDNLIKALPQNITQSVIVYGAFHNDISLNSVYYPTINAFLND
ncbi:alpha/beta hydrolase [Thalassotalea fusca]